MWLRRWRVLRFGVASWSLVLWTREITDCRGWRIQADLNQAIAMVSYYASSSEPAQVRGKTVYLQYSNRQEIVTSKNSGDVASNVLLVTIEGVEAGDVSIDVLHLVSDSLLGTWVGSVRLSGWSGVVQFVSVPWCWLCRWRG